MTVHIVSFLGLGNTRLPDRYEHVSYRFGHRESRPGPLVVEAIRELLGGTETRLTVVGTTDACEYWKPGSANGPFDRWYTGQPPEVRVVPPGKQEADLMEIFEVLRDVLDPAPGVRFVLDVTHGFRSQPLLAIGALLFQRAQLARQGKSLGARIVYGAFEARGDDGVAPLWDLTPILAAGQWTSALDAFMRYGRADELRELLGELSAEWRDRARPAGESDVTFSRAASYPRDLGRALASVADDLSTGRLRDLFTKSSEHALELTHPDNEGLRRLLAELPLMERSIADLRGWLQPLAAPNVLGEEGLRATAHYARLMGELQRFAEQAAALREGLITHVALLTSQPWVDAGVKGCDEARSAVESGEIMGYRGSAEDRVAILSAHGEAALEAAKLWGSVRQIRNDVEHVGINDSPVGASKVRARLHELSTAFSNLLDARTVASPPSSRRFVNLSNHPVSSWSDLQRQAAEAIGVPTDVSAELTVDPGATSEEVVENARTIADMVRGLGATAAHVATEPTLTFALVRELQSFGVRCYAATTHRRSTVAPVGDATVEKRSLFEFVGWREYPLGPDGLTGGASPSARVGTARRRTPLLPPSGHSGSLRGSAGRRSCCTPRWPGGRRTTSAEPRWRRPTP